MIDVKACLNEAEDMMQMSIMHLEEEYSHIRAVILLDEVGENMALKVVYLNERLAQRHRQTLGERSTDKE